jgi:hypothetical protein
LPLAQRARQQKSRQRSAVVRWSAQEGPRS